MKLFITLLLLSTTMLAQNFKNGWQAHETSHKRALWVWTPSSNKKWDSEKTDLLFRQNYKNSQDLLIEFSRSKSIRVLYLNIGAWEWAKKEFKSGVFNNEKYLAKLIQTANSHGMQVWGMYYINDASNDLNGAVEGTKHIINTVANFNKKFPRSKFAGIQSDQEPSKLSVYKDFLDFLDVSQKYCNKKAPDLIFSQTLKPKYIRDSFEWNGVKKPIIEHVIDICDHTSLMAYSQFKKTILRWSVPICEYASKKNKKVSIGLELNKLSGYPECELETWWEENLKSPLKTRFSLHKNSFEQTMQELEKQLSQYAGFDRMVIHSYKGYFAQWFSENAKFEPYMHPEDQKTWKFTPVDLTKDLLPLQVK